MYWIKKVVVFHVKYKYVQCKVRVTSLEQLCLAEFSGELARPKVYENGHKNILGICFDSVAKVKIWAHFSNKVHYKLKLSKYVNNKSDF